KRPGAEDASLRSPPDPAAGERGPRLDYVAPERRGSNRPPDPPSDIYSLGCVFCELLTGRPPFRRTDEGALPTSELPSGRSDLAGTAPDLPSEIRRLVGRMVARSRENRYQAMDEVVPGLGLLLGRHRSRFA